MQLDKYDIYVAIGAVALTYLVLQYFRKLPSAESIQDLLAALNSRGGNILILSCFSGYFFHHSLVMFYSLLGMVKEGALTQDNAFALMGLQFVTSTAFGGFSGALLKTMTGESSKARTSDTNGGPKVTAQLPQPGTGTGTITIAASNTPTKVEDAKTDTDPSSKVQTGG